MVPGPRNARLLRIGGGGSTGGYRRPPGADADKWSGDVGANVHEKVIVSTSGGTLSRHKVTALLIPGDLRPPVELKTGDTITYKYGNGEPVSRDLIEFEAQLTVAPKTVDIALEDATG